MASAAGYIEKMAGVSSVTFVDDKNEITEKVTSVVTHAAEVLVPLGDLIDMDKERERLQKEIAQVEAEITRVGNLLNNAGFVSKAPQKLVDGEREKLARAEEKAAKLKEKLAALD